MIIGATNFFERLDAALVRPGRMERQVHVPFPETEDESVPSSPITLRGVQFWL